MSDQQSKYEYKNYYIDHLDDQLERYPTVKMPATGWIMMIRKTLGMTIRQFAKRLNVAQSTALQYERYEQKSRITLNTLIKCADALDCELVYYFKPRQKLHNQRNNQAHEYVNKMQDQLNIYMNLEDQSVNPEQLKKEIEIEKRKLMDHWDNRIWNI